MSKNSSRKRVTELFLALLGRSPRADELERWATWLSSNGDFYQVFAAITQEPEFATRNRVKTAWVPGHFYSPIVDPELVRDYVAEQMMSLPDDIMGINFDLDRMGRIWKEQQSFISRTPFREEPVPGLRYYWRDSPYPVGDAVVYRAMINHLRPRRIIEVGSGFSSALALDTLDELDCYDVRLTCIEPHPEALLRRLRSEDLERVHIIKSVVQNVSLSLFEELSENDILFIDSTHVLKTGSDVHCELFQILPRLQSGVFVHFHDIRWPFEYPAPFIFERNFSWNEAYAIRALLMYSSRYSVYFYGGLFATRYRELARDTFPDFLRNTGSAIWIRA